ncbi:Glutathione peroxidase [Phytophthora palmivora]|uniref:Glutathione peroxidase n=1 Tax=Phytophthora palmivora TaxID=4796 RepID=A0A2P4XJ83_9STRA|nr:Glutathione peroxidase [Phytophthora palmivora]
MNMRSLLLVLTLVMALCSCNAAKGGKVTSFLDFSVPDLRGRQVSMREFNAFPVILVVNVASECGYTDKNYRELQELYEKYHDEGFMVLAFPCNQFGGQEPGTAEDILKFTQEKYHVTFPLFTKVDVNGENAHPLFQFLKKQLDGFITNDIKWNFTKFLIVNHEPFKRYGTTTSPLEIENDIVQALHSSRHVDAHDDGGATDGDYSDGHDEL